MSVGELIELLGKHDINKEVILVFPDIFGRGEYNGDVGEIEEREGYVCITEKTQKESYL